MATQHEENQLNYEIRRTALDSSVRMNEERGVPYQSVLRDAAAYERFLRGESETTRIDREAA